jgi:hypothetical protein
MLSAGETIIAFPLSLREAYRLSSGPFARFFPIESAQHWPTYQLGAIVQREQDHTIMSGVIERIETVEIIDPDGRQHDAGELSIGIV